MWRELSPLSIIFDIILFTGKFKVDTSFIAFILNKIVV